MTIVMAKTSETTVMNCLLKNSTLTEKEAEEIGHKIKKETRKRFN